MGVMTEDTVLRILFQSQGQQDIDSLFTPWSEGNIAAALSFLAPYHQVCDAILAVRHSKV